MSQSKTLDISVIIPFKDKSALTNTCLDSLEMFADRVKEVILVSNNSSEREKDRVVNAAARYDNARVITWDHPYNFHSINNFAAKQATGKVLFLLNNDAELVVESREVIRAMYKKALRNDVGAVGCVLLYEDRKSIQHAGVFLVPGNTADHLYARKKLQSIEKLIDQGKAPYDITDDLEMIAVTAAAVMIEKKKYDEVGGLNEQFIIGGGDVDICMRLREKGYRTWLVGSKYGHIIHKESKSRSHIGIPYSDFINSYNIYIKFFDMKHGDPFLHWQEVHRV